MEVRESVVGVYLDRRFEITDGVLMIAHVLVHQTTLDIDRLIIW